MPKHIPTAKPAGAGAEAASQLADMNRWSIPDSPAEKREWAWANPIYIYNVGRYTWKQEMGGLGPWMILGKEEGERYSKPTIVPRIFEEHVPVDIRKMEVRDVSGLELAKSIVGLGQTQGKRDSLIRWGVFISHTDPPQIEEVEEAEKALMLTYHELVKQGDDFYNQGPIEHRNITASMREALQKTNQVRPWGVASINMEVCPGCQSSINPGVVVHTCGAVLNWDKAIELGIKKASDRPEAAVISKK